MKAIKYKVKRIKSLGVKIIEFDDHIRVVDDKGLILSSMYMRVEMDKWVWNTRFDFKGSKAQVVEFETRSDVISLIIRLLRVKSGCYRVG